MFKYGTAHGPRPQTTHKYWSWIDTIYYIVYIIYMGFNVKVYPLKTLYNSKPHHTEYSEI